MRNLARAVKGMGQHAEAADLICEMPHSRVLGPDHCDTLVSTDDLANALQTCGIGGWTKTSGTW